MHGHEFVGSREQSVDLVLAPGLYAVMACTYNPGHESAHAVAIYAEKPVVVQPAKDWIRVAVVRRRCRLPQRVSFDRHFFFKKILLRQTGVWRGTTAGGCMNNKTWPNNPQFQLAVTQPTSVTVTLSPVCVVGAV